MRGGWRPVVTTCLLALVFAACTSTASTPDDTVADPTTLPTEAPPAPETSSPETGEGPTTTSTIVPEAPASSTTTTVATTTTGPPPTSAAPSDARCRQPSDAVAWRDGPSVEVPIVDTLDDGTVIRAAVYPRPDYQGAPWSQWGEGIVLSDGRVLSAIGDHEGADGNSFLFAFDPDSARLTRIGDVLSVVDHTPGDWGFGKIHAQMVDGPCGDVLVSTYWGTRRGLEFTQGYRGDVLLRIDPRGETISRHGSGPILDGYGVASMAATPDGAIVVAEAADPHDDDVGAFVALDGYTGERLLVVEQGEIDGFRAMSVDDTGEVYVTWSGDGLAVYDPVANSLEPTSMRMPGSKLRASVHGADVASPVAVTQDPERFFRIEGDGRIDELGAARGYTTSMASPDLRRIWYIPWAHGGAAERGTPIVEFDTETGSDQVLVELQPTAGEALGMRLGGTYNFLLSEDGSTMYVGLNAAPIGSGESFGEVVFVVVELP